MHLASRACILRKEKGTILKRLAVKMSQQRVWGDSGEGVDLVVKEIESAKKGMINRNQRSYAIGHSSKMETFWKD